MTTPARIGSVLAAVITSACMPTPPAPAPVREATSVDASFEKTWAAAIDQFAGSNVPIATIEKASGLIATPQLGVGPLEAAEFADCGTTMLKEPILASSVVYNVLVRGDSASSTVKVTASWTRPMVMCSSRGLWESVAELSIRERAEGRAPGSLVAEQFPTKAPIEYAPLDVPAGARFIASISRKTLYPIRSSCTTLSSLSANDLLYFSVVQDALQQGFRKSSDPGCEISSEP